MATCTKCGKIYLSKECPDCNNQKIEKIQLNEKEKLFKTIRYAIIIFMGLLIIGIITDVIITTYFVKTVSPVANSMNKMTQDMIKQQEKLMKQINKGLKMPKIINK